MKNKNFEELHLIQEIYFITRSVSWKLCVDAVFEESDHRVLRS